MGSSRPVEDKEAQKGREKWTVGVISDTHGLLRPEAIAALRGSDYIIHAGDVGDPGILKELASIAPVTAVRGNIDRDEWARDLPESDVLQVGPISVYVLHDVSRLDLDPAAARFSVVVFGHSHRPSREYRNRVLFFNPGAAGPRRFSLPVSVGRLRIASSQLSAEIITLMP